MSFCGVELVAVVDGAVHVDGQVGNHDEVPVHVHQLW
jgi:hypothetical protein